jgi:hypothetical protein
VVDLPVSKTFWLTGDGSSRFGSMARRRYANHASKRCTIYPQFTE